MKYILLFFVGGLFFSCFNEGDCLITSTNQMRIQFKKRTKTTVDTLMYFAYNSIEVVDKNIVFRINSPKSSNSLKSDILLPLRNDQDSTTFIFHRINQDSSVQATDIIKVGYARQARIISKDCGTYTFYQNLKILKTNLDEAAQIKSFSTSLLMDPTTSPTPTYALNYQIFY